MKDFAQVILTLILLAMATPGCAQKTQKEGNAADASGPELRWKYETGG